MRQPIFFCSNSHQTDDKPDTIPAMAEAVTRWRDEIEEWYAKDPKRREAAREWYEKVMEGMKNGEAHRDAGEAGRVG